MTQSTPKHRQQQSVLTSAFSEIRFQPVLAVAVLVCALAFFQFHIPVGKTELNINLGDPFAAVAFAIVAVYAFRTGQWPSWRIRTFNAILLGFTALLTFGYVVAYERIGFYGWTLSARVIGWLVLLSYLATGYLLVRDGGASRLRLMVSTMALASGSVIAVDILTRLLTLHGWIFLDRPANFEGYSGNRNAFAFQLLIVLALVSGQARIWLHVSPLRLNARRHEWRVWLPIGVTSAGIVWTASRAGIATAVLLLITAWLTRMLPLRAIVKASLLATALILAVVALERAPLQRTQVMDFVARAWSAVSMTSEADQKAGGSSNPSPTPNENSSQPDGASVAARARPAVQSAISTQASNAERAATIKGGFELWRQSPLTGAGLGVFHFASPEIVGRHTVIHSTVAWLFFEFGLAGLAFIVLASLAFGREALPALRHRASSRRRGLLLVCIAFAVFSQFHEMFYQRFFWLALGGLLAVPIAIKNATR